MEKLVEENITGDILQHMYHTEDLVLEGSKATQYMYNTLVDVFNALKGNTTNSHVTVKLDGAPNVTAASNYHGRAFVGTKYSFKPKTSILREDRIAYTEEEVSKVSDNLVVQQKLKLLLKALPYINIPKDEIWAGDYLFSDTDLKQININGEEYLSFQPNTIVYAVPVDDLIAKMMRRSIFGVAWHTKYTGPDYEHLHVGFDVTMNQINEVPSVFQMDASLPSIAGKVTMTAAETSDVQTMLESIKSNIDKITNESWYSQLIENRKYVDWLNNYRNVVIRTNTQDVRAEGFKEWLSNKLDKAVEGLKTEAGKVKARAKNEEYLNFLSNEQLAELYNLQNQIRTVKEFFVKKLDSIATMKTFLNHVEKGYFPANAEGYAVSDIDGNVQKIVSRLEFSQSNFSKDIIKGWTSEARDREMISESLIKKFKEGVQKKDISQLSPGEEKGLEIVQKAEEVKGTPDGLESIDTTQPYSYGKEEKSTPDLNLKVQNSANRDDHEIRKQAYSEIEDYVEDETAHEGEEFDTPIRYKAADGTHLDYLTLKQDGKKIVTVRLKTDKRKVGRSIDASDLFKGGLLIEGSYVFTDLENYKNIVLNNVQKLFPENLEVYKLYDWCLSQESPIFPANTIPKEIQDILNSDSSILVNLAEILFPYLIVKGTSFPSQDLVPDNFLGKTPTSIVFPKSSVQKFIDSIIKYEDGSTLNISAKAGDTLKSSVGETNIITLMIDPTTGLSTVKEDDPVKESKIYKLYECLQKAKRFLNKKRINANAIPFWMYGAQLCGLSSIYSDEEMIKHYLCFTDIYKYNGQETSPIEQMPYLKGGEVYTTIKDFMARYIDEFNSSVIASNYRINKELFLSETSFPRGLTTAFSQIVAMNLEMDLPTKQWVAKNLRSKDYYQYKLIYNKGNFIADIQSVGGTSEPNVNSFKIYHKEANYNGNHAITTNGINVCIKMVH